MFLIHKNISNVFVANLPKKTSAPNSMDTISLVSHFCHILSHLCQVLSYAQTVSMLYLARCLVLTERCTAIPAGLDFHGETAENSQREKEES